MKHHSSFLRITSTLIVIVLGFLVVAPHADARRRRVPVQSGQPQVQGQHQGQAQMRPQPPRQGSPGGMQNQGSAADPLQQLLQVLPTLMSQTSNQTELFQLVIDFLSQQDRQGQPSGIGMPPGPAASGESSDEVSCHNLDTSIVRYGYNQIVDADGNAVAAQGKPLQHGYSLLEIDEYVDSHNDREYARIFSYMAPIRDALICHLNTTSESEWEELTEILTINNIKITQDLSSTPKEQFYSTEGIYEHLTTDGADFHPMMKFLEEAELELKCLAFEGYDFTNPEGDNHCEIYGLEEGSGLQLP